MKVVKMHNMKPLKSVSGSKGIQMALEDINAETLKCELGAMIPHDVMYDADRAMFTDAYKESEAVDNG